VAREGRAEEDPAHTHTLPREEPAHRKAEMVEHLLAIENPNAFVCATGFL
jgi:hypothetical protein